MTNTSTSTSRSCLSRASSFLATLLIGLALPVAVQAQGDRALVGLASAHQAARPVGTWEFVVGFVNCDTGAALGPPFRSLHTYSAEGTFLEQGATAGPPPSTSRSVGQGLWRRGASGVFEVHFRFFTFDATGKNLAQLVIDEELEFTGGHTADLRAVAQVLNPAGVKVATNCVTGSGRRLRFAD